MTALSEDAAVVQRLLDHIDRETTDQSDSCWREPVANYRSQERFAAEVERVLRRTPTPFCPSAALREHGSYIARDAAGTPLVAVRGNDGQVRAFRNACRHRGTQLASGSGCVKAFVCRYHGWTYGLDGGLRHVPHPDGFPGLDKSTRGLVPVETVERHGVVFVTQQKAPAPSHWDSLPPLIAPHWRLSNAAEREISANWKVLIEGFLEGYHIRSTHPKTFYPVQFDNLNVVETFGSNSRVAYPYQAIDKLRTVSPAERSVDGKLTYVYHLFPNAIVATFPENIFLSVLEPLATDRTLLVTYVLSNRGDDASANGQGASSRGLALVDAGAAEDRAVACAIQRGLASGANEFFEFGLFEGAIAHFHRTLDAALDGSALASSGS